VIPLEVLLNPGHLLRTAMEADQVELTTDNPTLAVLKDLVEAMKAGQDIEDLHTPLVQLTSNSDERAKLVRALILTQDYSRLTNYLIIRDRLEQLMLGHALEGTLSAAEGLSFLRTVREEISKIESSVIEGASSGADITTLLNKVNTAARVQEDVLAKKIKGSPQNRELVRKLIYRLTKMTRTPMAKSSIKS